MKEVKKQIINGDFIFGEELVEILLKKLLLVVGKGDEER